jgi:hypothetical protein
MLLNDASAAQYMGEGDGAMHDNVTANLAGHMLSRPAQGVGGGLHPLEDEPTTNAEKAEKAALKISQGVSDGSQAAAPTFNFSDTADQVRSATRPGA